MRRLREGLGGEGLGARVLRHRLVKRFGAALVLVGVLSGIGLVSRSELAPPPLVFAVTPAGAQAIPAGCPGGPVGPAGPSTVCPDGSMPGQTPAGCPGGPPGPPVPGTACPDG
ncbi:MAG TPA: hypothetical protein VGO78_26370, partial [Acidimicrobiales bacterium]|nr:hypothetical protein [Acidimicrobiales bacterium]